eukprot:scaffold25182_cov62-Phaeocystis_antarctica.AAC.16
MGGQAGRRDPMQPGARPPCDGRPVRPRRRVSAEESQVAHHVHQVPRALPPRPAPPRTAPPRPLARVRLTRAAGCVTGVEPDGALQGDLPRRRHPAAPADRLAGRAPLRLRRGAGHLPRRSVQLGCHGAKASPEP